ncbi:unnamed protein product [Spodoptera littoralis]|uniref:Uncharacterized protein n=1 Tax=Spodoptera littoralis TaxID=7109 RepID=A0A9P0HXM3_SPOLI|nr:unnamed protein product [Spodoptera littoralis]CAH1637314.1 unnamed protein product [Spodoptera littoralis]
MAITSFDISCNINKVPIESTCSAISSKGENSCRLLKINIATDRSLSSNASRRTNKSKKNSSRSPYLANDRVQLLSRVTEKRMVHQKTTDIVSSFPLAVNIYKASSDEFKSPKKAKKVKKSVLTLPNDPAPTPQICTVSDMNDSEYCEKLSLDRKQKVIKKRNPTQNNRKTRVRQKDFEFYDRDARFCSQLNIDLDCSSTDMMKNFNGDGSKVFTKKKLTSCKPQSGISGNLSDVWTVLRNINKFQFRPSPPASEESIIPVKNKSHKRRRNRKDARVIETCHTKEFAYISSYEVDDKSPRTFSPSSSADRITVIEKQNEFSKICKEFEKRLLKTHDFLKDSSNTVNTKIKSPKLKNQFKSSKKNMKAITNVGTKEHKPTLKKKKKKAKRPIDQQSKFAPTSSSGNRDSLLDAETLKLNYNSDVSLHKAKTNDSTCHTKGSFVYSDYSGSSKAELPQKQDEQKSIGGKLLAACSQRAGCEVKAFNNTYLDATLFRWRLVGGAPSSRRRRAVGARAARQKSNVNSVLLVNNSSPVGITKEQLLPTSLILPKECDPPKRKPRLVTTMPSSCIIPKLTQTEVKRRLANIRFPIVVLGKDQVSSGVKVIDYDPPQFSGLEDHIWPFMVDWSSKTTKTAVHHNSTINKKSVSFVSDTNSSKSRKTNTKVTIPKPSPVTCTDKKTVTIETAPINKKKVEVKYPPSTDIADKLLQCSKKQKSIVQLKDKMLNFLYKKTSNRTVNSNIDQNVESKSNPEIELKPTNPSVLNDATKRKAVPNSFPVVGRNKKPQIYTYPWAKAKWASDFIENVIRKIRNGVYYNQEHKDFSQIFPIGNIIIDYISIFKLLSHYLTKFNNVIKIINIIFSVLDLKEVSVQTGSLCDFSDSTQSYDSDTDPVHDLIELPNIPGFNHTQPVLEIKTLNTNQIAVKHCVTNVMVQFDVTVPAKDTKSTTSITKTLPLIPLEVTDSHTKVYKCKTTIFNGMLPAEICSILPKMMNNIINSSNTNIGTDNSFTISPTKTESCLSTITEQARYENAESLSLKILSDLSTSKLRRSFEGSFSNKALIKPIFKKNVFQIDYNICFATDLLPQVSLDDLLQYEVSPLAVEVDNCKYEQLHLPSNGPVTDLVPPTCTTLAMYTSTTNRLTAASSSCDLIDMMKSLCDCKQHKIDSLFKASPKGNVNKRVRGKAPIKCIEYVNTVLANRTKSTEVSQVTFNKVKRKGLYKLYRKCKSTTNVLIPGDKNPYTPLNKITTMDEFFQVLGSKKLLSSVFDGYSSEKILSSILEMKNWISEINAKQALLILLLTNKKDTQNLVRFRPIILQGIAVNRITRATELDMEIEVIERENLNKFSQFDGISYLPASVTEYDNLLEELYWIAKTTASDYQRPFDESSERLLKSLLEKRKKLNPSYLRVMARYVGLGLLKPPAKC